MIDIVAMPCVFNSLLAEANIMEHVQDKRLSHDPLFSLCGHPVYFTSHMIMIFLAAILMLLIFSMMGAKARRSPIPTGMQNFFEAIMSFLRTDVFQPVLGENTDRFVHFLWTLFFFILFCNVLGLLPISSIILIINGKAGTHLPEIGGTATGNISVTVALALVAFVMFHVSGVIQQVRIQMDPSLAPHHHGHDTHAVPAARPLPVALVAGLLRYVKNLVPTVPLWLWPLMFVLELIGALVKPFSLCMRLFANMIAGHLVLASFLTLIFLVSSYFARGAVSIPVVLGCAAFSILEVFVAFLQAYIFTFLTTLFISAAVSPEH